MPTQYIEIDSTYRDRNKFPNPSYFEVPFEQSGAHTRFDALDPVSDAAAKIVFSPNDFSQAGATNLTGTVSAIGVVGVGNATSPQSIRIDIPVGQLAHQEMNYYRGVVLQITTATTVERQVIDEWRYLLTTGGNDVFKVDLMAPFSSAVQPADVIAMNNSTDLTDTSHPVLFTPFGVNSTQFYYGDLIYNQDLQEYRRIDYYSSISHNVEVDATLNPVVGWLDTHTYVLRYQPPLETGVAAGGSISSVTLAAAASTVDGFYVGSFVRMTSGAAYTFGANNDSRRIITYDGATRVATVTPDFVGAVVAGNTYEILEFTRDNEYPLQYSGSITSHREAVCYDIELLNLILPNSTLISGYGGRAIFYPFLYVELIGINNSERAGPNLIYSNNPNSKRMLFRAVVSDTTRPAESPFVKIDGSGMRQRVKFMPNDSFIFAVYIPDGELLTTEAPETFGPNIPNPFIQVSAIFAISRVE